MKQARPSKEEVKEQLAGSFKIHVNGWTITRFEGDGFQRGFQNGYLMADEVVEVIESLKLYVTNVLKRSWSFFREAASNM